MPDTPANNDIGTKILDRFDQVEKKITGELIAVRGEVKSVRERVDKLDEKVTGEFQFVRKEAQGFHNYEKALARVNEEIEELKRDKVLKESGYSRFRTTPEQARDGTKSI